MPLRLVRIARFVSVVRLLGLQCIVNKSKKTIRTLVYQIEYILLCLVIFIFVSAFLMWQIETSHEGSITTFVDALWWAVVTITTIGYGDLR